MVTCWSSVFVWECGGGDCSDEGYQLERVPVCACVVVIYNVYLRVMGAQMHSYRRNWRIR